MPKKKKGKGKSKATTPFDQDAFDRTMSVLPPPTPGTGKRIGRSIWRPEGYLVCRVNELVTVRFANDPDGLVEHLRTLPKEEGGLNAVNECGWTALMRSARDGLKANVLALVEAGADVTLESTEDVTETHVDNDTDPGQLPRRRTVVYPKGSTAADLCRQRHSSHAIAPGKQTPSTYFLVQEILQLLQPMDQVDVEEAKGQGEPWTRRFLGKPICTPEQSRLLGTPPSFHAMSTTLEQSSKTLASQYEGYYQDDL